MPPQSLEVSYAAFAARIPRLAALYEGKDVDRDYAAALKWYRKAADLGDTNSMLSLAVLYAEGQGVAKDKRMAADWLRRAAGGNPEAKEILRKQGER